MRKAILVLLIAIILIFYIGCVPNEGDNSNMIRYYSIDDFRKIVVDQSTYYDVCNAIPENYKISLYATSFGAIQEYPTLDNNWIRIRYYGSNLVVGSIEVVMEQWGQDR